MANPKRFFSLSGVKSRRFLVLLCCMALAFFMWLMHKLSLDYSSNFRYEVTVQADLESYSSEAESEELMLIRGKATGFYILKSLAKKTLSRIVIPVSSRELRPNTIRDDHFAVAAQPLLERISEQLDGMVWVEAVLIDSIHVSLKKMATKKCKVVFNGSVSYQSQYTSFVPIRLIPDSVLITGMESTLTRIDSIRTVPVYVKNLDRDMQGVVDLMLGDDLSCPVREIRYQIYVTRYSEHAIKREITVVNQPSGVHVLLLPSQVSIRFRAPYDTPADYYNDNFQPVISFSTLEKSVSGTVIPHITKQPEAISHVMMDPPIVECIIQKRR